MLCEVGDRLFWFDTVLIGQAEDLPMDAPERYATVTEVEEDGTVHVLFDDDESDWFPPENLRDYFERVTWDAK